jgi:hypothetical protein
MIKFKRNPQSLSTSQRITACSTEWQRQSFSRIRELIEAPSLLLN